MGIAVQFVVSGNLIQTTPGNSLELQGIMGVRRQMLTFDNQWLFLRKRSNTKSTEEKLHSGLTGLFCFLFMVHGAK